MGSTALYRWARAAAVIAFFMVTNEVRTQQESSVAAPLALEDLLEGEAEHAEFSSVVEGADAPNSSAFMVAVEEERPR